MVSGGYRAAADRGCVAGRGFNLNVPLLPGHRACLDAFELLVEPALRAFQPKMIVVASGLDANGVDPLARMLARSETFRWLTGRVLALAQELCGGRAVFVHEGGYSDLAVPFCGLAVVEELVGRRSRVIDPRLDVLERQQPPGDMVAFQRARLETQSR